MDNELIKQYEDNTKAIMATEQAIVQAVQTQQTQLKALQARDTELKTAIKEAMEANGVKKFESDLLNITYVAPVDRTIFDSTRFKVEQPETYAEYTKKSSVKSSIRIKVKDESER